MKAFASALLLTVAAILFHSSLFAQQAVKFDSATISGLPVRNIGSAMMSGRVAAIDAITEDGRLTVFVWVRQWRGLEVRERRPHF